MTNDTDTANDDGQTVVILEGKKPEPQVTPIPTEHVPG
jgi:hypothetical protein